MDLNNKPEPSEVSRAERRRRERENYNTVRTYSPALYSRIAAFASTLNLSGSDEDTIRVRVESFCMAIVAAVHRDGA